MAMRPPPRHLFYALFRSLQPLAAAHHSPLGVHTLPPQLDADGGLNLEADGYAFRSRLASITTVLQAAGSGLRMARQEAADAGAQLAHLQRTLQAQVNAEAAGNKKLAQVSLHVFLCLVTFESLLLDASAAATSAHSAHRPPVTFRPLLHAAYRRRTCRCFTALFASLALSFGAGWPKRTLTAAAPRCSPLNTQHIADILHVDLHITLIVAVPHSSSQDLQQRLMEAQQRAHELELALSSARTEGNGERAERLAAEVSTAYTVCSTTQYGQLVLQSTVQ